MKWFTTQSVLLYSFILYTAKMVAEGDRNMVGVVNKHLLSAIIGFSL
jgi:hypothetical protein